MRILRLVVAALAALTLAGAAYGAVNWPTGRPLKLLVVGDSVAAGWKASTPAKAFPALLAAQLRSHGHPVALTVKAVPGVTADYWTAKPLPAADLIVVELGTNDYGGPVTTPLATFAGHYRAAIAHVKASAAGATVVCLALWRSLGSAHTRQYNAVIQHDCPGTYVQIDELYDKPGMRSVSDHFHPGNLGHAQIAKMIETALGV